MLHPTRSTTAGPASPSSPWVGEARATARLALPIIAVQLAMIAMGTVDVMMVGHYSGDALAAVAIGHLYAWSLLVFGFGVLTALDPVVAQAVGARDEAAVRRGVQRGILLACLLAVPLSVACLPAETVLGWLGQPEDITPLAGAYARWSIPGVLPFLVFVALRQSLQAMSSVAPVLWTILLANIANAGLNWALIFGRFGAPELGSTGAAISTSACRWLMAVGLALIAARRLRPYLTPWDPRAWRARPLWRLFRLGTPLGCQFLLEMGAFATTALFMGWISKVALASHQVAINLASISFMVPVGISAAAGVRVGVAVGRGDAGAVRRATAVAVGAGTAVMSVFAVLFLSAPAAFAAVYTDDRATLALTTLLIPLAGVFQVFDGLQVVSVGVLRGLGETRTALIVNLIGFWMCGVPAGYLLAFPAGLGPIGLWWGLVLGLVAVSMILVVRVAVRLRQELRRVDLDAG